MWPGRTPLRIYHGLMSKWLRAGVAAGLVVAAGALGVLLAFLLRQGLAKASMWATFLVLPLTVVIAIAGIWAAVLAAQGLHADRGPTDRSTAAEPGVGSSGSVYQTNTDGPAIAHTGLGDINFGERETTERSDEST